MDTDGTTLAPRRRRRQASSALPFPLPVALFEADGSLTLSACSVCLRVWRSQGWVEAEHVIRELRSFELAAPPRLEAALCDRCVDSLHARRTRSAEPLAA
jgi:hypothetical protein